MKIDLSGFMEWVNRPQTRIWVLKASRILAILLGILSVAALILLSIFIGPALMSGNSLHLFALLDEMDDIIEAILFLIGGTAVFAFVSRFLKNNQQTEEMTVDQHSGE